jgi:hypothetical protein
VTVCARRAGGGMRGLQGSCGDGGSDGVMGDPTRRGGRAGWSGGAGEGA